MLQADTVQGAYAASVDPRFASSLALALGLSRSSAPDAAADAWTICVCDVGP